MTAREVLVRGGEVVDGTGAPAYRADVRVRDGRIVEVAPDLRPDGEAGFDASGAFVAPGFIDTHAHTDPQVFWDPTLDPEPVHGVTTMLVGNCSLSLYPVNDTTRDEIADLFAYVEDVPRHLFDDQVPWTWVDYAGYRDAVNAGGAGTNLAALVGHSPLRLAIMGQDAWTRVATAGRARGHGEPAPGVHGCRRVGAVDVTVRRRRARAVRCPPAPPTTPRSTRSSTSSEPPDAAWSRSFPGSSTSTTPSRRWRTWPGGAAPGGSRSPGPRSPTATPTRAAPRPGSTWRDVCGERASSSSRSSRPGPSTSVSTGTPR